MKEFMFAEQGKAGECLINIFDELDNYPYVITWRFLEYGKACFLVSIVDTFGMKYMTECNGMNEDGEFKTEFEIVTDSDEKYTITVTFYEDLDRLYICIENK